MLIKEITWIKNPRWWMCFLTVITLLLLNACQTEINIVPTPALIALPHESKPLYLMEVYPPAKASISLAEFQNRATFLEAYYETDGGDVCLKLDVQTIVEPGDDIGWEEAKERTLLWINDQKVELGEIVFLPVEKKTVFENGQEAFFASPFYMCWPIELESGIKVVKFEYQKLSGEKLSYSWYFELTE